jgi:hypothetical protein
MVEEEFFIDLADCPMGMLKSSEKVSKLSALRFEQWADAVVGAGS